LHFTVTLLQRVLYEIRDLLYETAASEKTVEGMKGVNVPRTLRRDGEREEIRQLAAAVVKVIDGKSLDLAQAMSRADTDKLRLEAGVLKDSPSCCRRSSSNGKSLRMACCAAQQRRRQ
jgi:hypothetical protein